MKILFCYGTRPEFIKIKNFFQADKKFDLKVLYVKQHEDIVFGYHDYTLDIIDNGNRLNDITSSILNNIGKVLDDNFDYVLVQGDTATAFAISLACYHKKIKVIHLESGLRTYDKNNPYPEEVYRQLISKIADIHLCPTIQNRQNLIDEKTSGNIFVVGNTVLDNLINVIPTYENKVLVTLHRRENHDNIKDWFSEIDKIAEENPEFEFLLPIHPNPNVIKHKNLFKYIKVINPLPHNELIDYLKKCKVCITDSGGLQEESSFLGKKVIVCRKVTERTETLGTNSFICETPNNLKSIFNEIKFDYISNEICPYGDGLSTKKIIEILNNLS